MGKEEKIKIENDMIPLGGGNRRTLEGGYYKFDPNTGKWSENYVREINVENEHLMEITVGLRMVLIEMQDILKKHDELLKLEEKLISYHGMLNKMERYRKLTLNDD